MTNTELVNELMQLFTSYFTFFMPIFGVFAAVHLVINLLWAVTFGQFDAKHFS